MGRIHHRHRSRLVEAADAGVARLSKDAPVTGRSRPDADEVNRLIQLGRDREAAELAGQCPTPTDKGTAMDPCTQIDAILPLLCDLVAPLEGAQLDAPTPCANFDVRGVLQHMVGGATMFAAAFRGETPQAPDLDGDLVAAFPVALSNLQQAVRSPGALERTVSAPFGDVPGDVFARFVALDGLVHGWDIATATGQRYEPPADVVATVDAFARQAITDDLRDGDTFAAAVEPPAGASPLVALVAFTGRQV